MGVLLRAPLELCVKRHHHDGRYALALLGGSTCAVNRCFEQVFRTGVRFVQLCVHTLLVHNVIVDLWTLCVDVCTKRTSRSRSRSLIKFLESISDIFPDHLGRYLKEFYFIFLFFIDTSLRGFSSTTFSNINATPHDKLQHHAHDHDQTVSLWF